MDEERKEILLAKFRNELLHMLFSGYASKVWYEKVKKEYHDLGGNKKELAIVEQRIEEVLSEFECRVTSILSCGKEFSYEAAWYMDLKERAILAGCSEEEFLRAEDMIVDHYYRPQRKASIEA